jgi:hypothetical protein
MKKLKTNLITAIKPHGWKQFVSVSVDNDTFTDSSWNGCDYRIDDDPEADNHGLAIDIYITGRKSVWKDYHYITAARIVFPNDGEPDEHSKGKVSSREPLV